jgi:DNA-binding NtrC family response regulator
MNGRILLVDDDASILNTVRVVLQRAGYDALLAHNGPEAMALLAQMGSADRINTVICDLDMPNMKGVELIGHIHSQYPHIPIVVLSGTTDDDFLDGITRQGVSDWLRKPVTNTALLAKVRTAVQRNELRKRTTK